MPAEREISPTPITQNPAERIRQALRAMAFAVSRFRTPDADNKERATDAGIRDLPGLDKGFDEGSID